MNKVLFIFSVSLLVLVSFSILGAQEKVYAETMDHITEMGGSLEMWIAIAHWITGVSTAILAIAIFKTFRHLEATTKMSKIETEYRLRPWIGPITGIKRMDNSISGGFAILYYDKEFWRFTCKLCKM